MDKWIICLPERRLPEEVIICHAYRESNPKINFNMSYNYQGHTEQRIKEEVKRMYDVIARRVGTEIANEYEIRSSNG